MKRKAFLAGFGVATLLFAVGVFAQLFPQIALAPQTGSEPTSPMFETTPSGGDNLSEIVRWDDDVAPLGPGVSLQPYLTGLSSPMMVTNANDGTGRLFVVQRGGIIRVVQPGSTTPTNFMTVSGVATDGERGLLGLAFHPQFAGNGYFFVHYNRTSDGATVISRFSAINNNTLGDPASQRILIICQLIIDNSKNGGRTIFR